MSNETTQRPRESRTGWIVFALALLVAAVSARPFAGGWNDSSRLASVESVVDHGTMSIDKSIYVDVPQTPPSPFRESWTSVLATGTLDRMFVDGKFYSDKPPLTSLILALEYAGVQRATGLTASRSPGAFAWTMTLLSSGLAYALAVTGVWYTARQLRLTPLCTTVLTITFALSSIAIVYARHVNSHILLLGAAVWVMALMVRLTRADLAPNRQTGTLLGLGALLGLGYTLESAAGPLLAGCVGLWAVLRLRNVRAVVLIGLASLPFVVAHHVINYNLFGMVGPANANPAFFSFPGSVFSAQNMTGRWNHPSFGSFVAYASSLWVGRRGFAMHNLPVLLAIPGAVWLLIQSLRGRSLRGTSSNLQADASIPTSTHISELLTMVGWAMCVSLVYGALSTVNSRGINCSVRWFVPLLAPVYLSLAMFLAARPRWVVDLGILGAFGLVVISAAWVSGPFVVTDFNYVLIPTFAALLCWGIYRARTLRDVFRSPQAASGVVQAGQPQDQATA